MNKNRFLLVLVCLLFMLNSFNFNVQALSSRAIGNVNIVSQVDTSLETIEAWARSKNATETFVSLAKLYKQYAESRGGVNWVLGYVQAAKETGYGKFGGVLDESYHNPCGLKNPAGGDDYDKNAHKRFDNWEQGVIAHLDHLALYAAADGYPKTTYVDSWKNEQLSSNETYDPRHIGWFGTTSGILGKAKDVLSLTGSWASDPNYGIELFRLYCDATQSEYLPARSNLESPSNSEVITNGKLRIKGWALHAFGIKEIKVLVDNSQVATINTGVSRADVNSAYPGYFNGDNSGFDETIDISNLGTGNKTVEVKIIARNDETQSYKRNIVVKDENVSLPKISNLDSPTNNSVVTDGNLKIRGWALDQVGVKEVRVYIDNKDFGPVTYGTTRVDVNKAYPGYSSGNNAGFDATIDVSSLTSGNKKVVVKITSNDGTSQNIERTINIQKLQSRSSLDEPTSNSIAGSKTLKIRGWALDSSGIKEVRVYVDGKDLGTVAYGTTRTDVNKVYPGYSSGDNAGFEGTVNISSIYTGSKKLTVKITASDGTIQTIDRTIKIEKLASRSCLDEPISNLTVASGQLKIRGWALADSGIKEVRVYADGKDLGTVNYGTTRTDVNKVYPGYSSGNNAGFEGLIDISSLGSGNKKLTIKITANDGTTQTIDRTVNVKNLPSINSLDEPTSGTVTTTGELKVRGWAVAASGVKEVRIYVDHIDLGTITYGTTRTDVNKVYPGYPSGNNAGFEGTINLGGMPTGEKTLKIKITANDGTTQVIERSFTYRKAKLVVVDPGHEIESVDPGATATHNGIRYVEGNLNLQIAVKLKAELEARGIEVYMTRYDSVIIDRDSTESLKKRVKVANDMNADLFVSIHHNSFTSSSANGFEVYYSTGTPITTYINERMITEDGRDLTLETRSYASRSNTDKVTISKGLATAIANEASSTLGLYNRGAKNSVLYVCKNTTMPSILIENGFLTNPTEAAKVSTTTHQQKLAEITATQINEVLK
ncbi:MAG: N-acetylmuramoyl-L-alanine amidase [Turicibacter sp.]|nr:N-acetylmuramoyl-L-alanine amidase [Turicibacter sp.]